MSSVSATMLEIHGTNLASVHSSDFLRSHKAGPTHPLAVFDLQEAS